LCATTVASANAAELHVVGLYAPRMGLFGREQQDVVDWPGWCAKLAAAGPKDEPSPEKQVWQLLPAEVQKMVRQPELIRFLTGRRVDRTEYAQRLKLVRAFENVLKSKKLYDIEAFARLKIPEATNELVVRRAELSRLETRWMNRLLLELAFPKEIKHRTDDPPEVVTVQVTTTQPVILALTAYEAVRWKIEPAEGAKIEKVILAGHDIHEIVGTRAEVQEFFQEGALPDTEPEWFYAWETQTGDFANLQMKLRKITSLPISTFQGQHRHDGKPFVIDGKRGKR
jgi:hypothetical protein